MNIEFKKIDISDSLQFNNAWRTVKNRFICVASTPLNRSVILPSTSDISDIFTEYGIHRKGWAGDHYRYREFGTIKKGALLSWCIENSHYLADGVTEIGVHTEEDHRQKGYAASNVATLCDCLLKNGVTTIYYECALDNTASFRTAQKANLEYAGEVTYLCFENKLTEFFYLTEDCQCFFRL